MAFLDNSGDILLDAVLTDEGRRRLAMGDGSFRITKFAVGDDEIDYSLYVPATSSGYEDIRIMQLPVFEAFTNNTTSLKSKLISYNEPGLLYLPVIKLNSKVSPTNTSAAGPIGGYYTSVDSATRTEITRLNNDAARSGGFRFADGGQGNDLSLASLTFDQGLDTANKSLAYLTPGGDQNSEEAGLFESQYLVEVDNRLLTLGSVQGGGAQPSFIDDDNIATYLFALNSEPQFFATQNLGRGGSIPSPSFSILDNPSRTEDSMIGPTVTTGRLGSRLIFTIQSTLNLQNSQALFTQIGGTTAITIGAESPNFSFINTVIRITGFTTGYRVEVPLKLLKFTA